MGAERVTLALTSPAQAGPSLSGAAVLSDGDGTVVAMLVASDASGTIASVMPVANIAALSPTVVPEPAASGLRCFVAAPTGVDTRLVVRALEQAGVTAVFPEDFAPTRETVLTVVHKALQACDLVVGVLAEGADTTSVAFELGMAAAMKKPAIALVARGTPLPVQLEEHVVVRGDTADTVALTFAVEQLTINLRQTTSTKPRRIRRPGRETPKTAPEGVGPVRQRPTPSPPTGTILGSAADEFLNRLEALGKTPREQDLVQILTDAFRTLGIVVVEGTPAARFDLGIWDPELAAIVGNPFVIEVKRTLERRDQIIRAVDQVSHYLAATGGRWALLAYGGGDAALIDESVRSTQVLATSIHDLLMSLRAVPFAELVQRLRAARVHGV